MKTILKIVGGLVALVLVAGGGVFLYAKSKLNETLGRDLKAHDIELPVPFPLSEQELAELRAERAAQAEAAAGAGAEAGADDPLAGVDLEAIALERAVARGKHLVDSRYFCVECHGQDFSGGVMVDDPALGSFLAPNLTLGEGSVTRDYTTADWDRIVRHGLKRDRHPGIMPSEDFERMTDQELSDIIAYIRAQPPVDNQVAQVTYGPVGTMLVAFGQIKLSYDVIRDHEAAHAERPPTTEATAAFGEHLVAICTGCHRPGLEGGPILQGDPSWPPARNLTPHEDGLAGWTFEQFDAAMRQGVRPDGSKLLDPMSRMPFYAVNMSDTEMRALWAYIQGVEAKPTPR